MWLLYRVMARERGQANVHVTVAMKGSCVMNVPSCTMKSRVKTLNQNALVSDLIQLESRSCTLYMHFTFSNLFFFFFYHLETNLSKHACSVP